MTTSMALPLFFTMVSMACATGCTSQVQQFAEQCGLFGFASDCEAQIACEWWSCYGKDSSFDSQCNMLADNSTCVQQTACSWGRPLVPHCFAATKDSGMMSTCIAASTEAACQGIIGCDWRLVDDAAEWLENMRSAAGNQYPCSCPDLRPDIAVSVPDFTGSAYDFVATAVTNLPNIASAWATKYNLPEQAVPVLALPDRESGNYTQSVTWKSNSLHYDAGSGTVTYQWLVSAGRQWNGIDSKAFVFMNAKAAITAPIQLLPSDLEAIAINITTATATRMRSTELVLLQQKMGGPQHGSAAPLVDMVV